MELGLKGKVAIVTGPAKGMGAAITLALAKEGVDLCLAGRDMAAIAPVTEEVRKLSRKVVEAKCDVTEAAEVEAMVKKTLDAFGGRIDILVNVAGGRGPLETTAWETTPEAFDEVIELNMKGCFLTMRAVTPTMQKQRSGKIVNIGGTFGLRGRALRMALFGFQMGPARHHEGLRPGSSGPTTSTSTTSARAWWTGHASARCARAWPNGSASAWRKPCASTPRSML